MHIRRIKVVKYLFALIIIIFIITKNNNVNEIKKAHAEENIWDGSVATEFAGGDGTESNPYQISNGSQLALLAKHYNHSKTHPVRYYVLTNDIVLNNTENWEDWGENPPLNSWEAIASFRHPFNGFFDGAGHSISGLYSYDYFDYGLFKGLAGNGSIKNVGIEKSYTKGYASIVSCIYSGIVENCYNSGVVIGNDNSFGGIAGENYSRGIIKNCYNIGKIYALNDKDNWIGGIVGSNNGKVIDCYNKGYVSGASVNKYDNREAHIGGIVGINHGKIIKSVNYVKIISNQQEILGGIAGYNYKIISECTNYGNISNGIHSKFTGGIVGEMNSGIIEKCINKGKITIGNNSSYVGGIVGGQDRYVENSKITDCYNIGIITSGKECRGVGGIAGGFNTRLINCFNMGKVKTDKKGGSIGGIIGETIKGTIINCINIGNVSAYGSSSVGGIVGDLGVWFVIGDKFPHIKPKLANCANLGNVGGKKCFYVGGIAGDSYVPSCNSYNSGNVIAQSFVGGIIGREMDEANIPSNCYYLEGCAKLVNTIFDWDTSNKYGNELTEEQMKSSILTKKLNEWIKKRDTIVYGLWSNASYENNNGYPYLINLNYIF